MVDEVDDEGGQLEAQLDVVHDGAALLPHAGLVPARASGALAADVVQVEGVPNYHVECADAQKNYLKKLRSTGKNNERVGLFKFVN